MSDDPQPGPASGDVGGSPDDVRLVQKLNAAYERMTQYVLQEFRRPERSRWQPVVSGMAQLCLALLLIVSTAANGFAEDKAFPDTTGYDVPDEIRALKYGAFVHYVWGGTGTRNPGPLQVNSDGTKPYKTIDEMVNAFPVEKFAEDIASMGVEYLIFTCWHYDMNPLYPSKVMDKWMKGLPDKTPDRDLIRDLINALKPKGVKLFLYLHPDDRGDFTGAEKRRVAGKKFKQFINEMYAECVSRYKGDVVGYWNDGGCKGRDLRKTMHNADPKAVSLAGGKFLQDVSQHRLSLITSNWWASDTSARHGGKARAEDMFKAVVLQAGANVQGTGTAIAFGVYGDGGWQKNVLESMRALGKYIEPVSASIKNVYAGKSYPTAFKTKHSKLDWGVATESTDGKHVYIHVLKPQSPSIFVKALALPAPQDGRKFGAAVLLRNGNPVELHQAPDGKVTLTLGAGDDWHKLDTVIRMTTR